MFKDIIFMVSLFFTSFYVSSLLRGENNINIVKKDSVEIIRKTVENKKYKIPLKTIHRKTDRATEKKELSVEHADGNFRDVASINYSANVFKETKLIENDFRDEKSLFSINILADDNISTVEKIDMIDKGKINFQKNSLTKKIILKEMMEISFKQEHKQEKELAEVTDMKKYLELISPSDEEVYFFELFRQLTQVVEKSELQEVSRDIYEKVENDEVKGLVVLHLLDNDEDNENLNFLIDNISKDKVVSHIPDNYIIENDGISHNLVINDGPMFVEEQVEVDKQYEEDFEEEVEISL